MQITNEMLYELIKEFKSDVNRRFDEERHYREKMELQIDRLEEQVREIYLSRDKVVARVTWDFLWRSTAFNAILLVFMAVVLKVI